VQTLLGDVTGKPFPALMRERVFGPAGMRDSTYEQPLPASLQSVAATAYRANGKPVDGRYSVYPEMAAAGLWTTPTDLARWLLALDEFLEPDTLEEMFREEKHGFGLGIATLGSGDDLEVSHGGSTDGFRCTFVHHPESGQGVVVMTNSDSGNAVATQVVHALARQFRWSRYEVNVIDSIEVAAGTLQDYAGRYAVPERPVDMVIAVEGERMYMVYAGTRQELVPVDEDVFASEQGGRIRFERAGGGKVTALLLGDTKLPRRE
jgi:CubicO group peptidase (beta-lactamase class C family)